METPSRVPSGRRLGPSTEAQIGIGIQPRRLSTGALRNLIGMTAKVEEELDGAKVTAKEAVTKVRV